MKKGGIREMIGISLPMVVSFGCDTAMTFTDRMFLSRLGPELMNAAMGGGLTAFMMMTFVMGLIGFSTAMVAQFLGAGQKSSCAVAAAQAALVAAAAYPLILLARPLGHLYFDGMGLAGPQLAGQKLYFNLVLYGAIFTLLRHTLSSFFSGIGRTRIVMSASFCAMTVNIVLNYMLIFGKCGLPALGIRGAAYGTIAGGGAGFAVLALAYFGKQNRAEFGPLGAMRPDWNVLRRLLRLGYPSGAEMLLNLLAFNTMVLLFHSRGPVTATAATIVFNWDMVSFVPLLGIEVGVTSLVGRYLGARDPGTAHHSVLSGIKMGLFYSAIIFVFFCFFPHMLAGVFRPAQAGPVFHEAFPLALRMIRLASLYVLADAVVIVFVGAFRGAGDTFWSMTMTTSVHWILTGVAALCLRILDWAADAAFLAVILAFLALSLMFYLRYRSGKWKNAEAMPMAAEKPAASPAAFHEPPDL